MRLTTRPLCICPADHRTILVVRIQNIVRDIKVGMLSRVVLVLFHLTLCRMNLGHRIQTRPAGSRLLQPQDPKHAIKLFPGGAVFLSMRSKNARQGKRDHRSA